MKINILISKNSWAIKYKKDLKKELIKFSKKINFIHDHRLIKDKSDVTIIFSYFKIISKNYLNKSKHNIIPHESKLPKGRGMSPLTWEILKNKTHYYFSLIEASESLDCGNIYFQKKIKISKSIIFNEIKKIQYKTNLQLIKKFLKKFRNKKKITSKKQLGSTYLYKRRTPKDSKINVNKTIKEQFNKLRVADPENYPTFFEYKKRKFIIKISSK